MIQVEHLTKRFGSFTAVDDLSFEVQRGEVVGFLGPNGAGKTTTMRMLTGYLPATEGKLSIAGKDVLRESLEVRRKIGYLPESVPLYRENRVLELLDFQGRLHRMPRKDIRRRADEVLERVGLGSRGRSLFGSLSKGMRQRVGLAMALLPNPDVLILDEPTSGLDPLQRLEVRKLLRELAEEHTVLLSSHILPEIEAVCPRVIILNHGAKAADGTPGTLVKSLGGLSFLRLEAMVPDPEEAARLLKSLPGIDEVEDQGRLGIHSVFRIPCTEDLREDVGALAAMKGWALRELSWQRPTLESIFSRIALELDGHEHLQAEDTTAAAAPAVAQAEPTLDASGLGSSIPVLPVAEPAATSGGAPPLGTPGKKRVVYNLNPFDQGGSRNLGKPKVDRSVAPAPRPASSETESTDETSSKSEGGGDA